MKLLNFSELIFDICQRGMKWMLCLVFRFINNVK